jgi:hypothetical protein
MGSSLGRVADLQAWRDDQSDLDACISASEFEEVLDEQ